MKHKQRKNLLSLASDAEFWDLVDNVLKKLVMYDAFDQVQVGDWTNRLVVLVVHLLAEVCWRLDFSPYEPVATRYFFFCVQGCFRTDVAVISILFPF